MWELPLFTLGVYVAICMRIRDFKKIKKSWFFFMTGLLFYSSLIADVGLFYVLIVAVLFLFLNIDNLKININTVSLIVQLSVTVIVSYMWFGLSAGFLSVVIVSGILLYILQFSSNGRLQSLILYLGYSASVVFLFFFLLKTNELTLFLDFQKIIDYFLIPITGFALFPYIQHFGILFIAGVVGKKDAGIIFLYNQLPKYMNFERQKISTVLLIILCSTGGVYLMTFLGTPILFAISAVLVVSEYINHKTDLYKRTKHAVIVNE